jgi:hypothetical protein
MTQAMLPDFTFQFVETAIASERYANMASFSSVGPTKDGRRKPVNSLSFCLNSPSLCLNSLFFCVNLQKMQNNA